MHKRNITFEDYNDPPQTHTQTFYFNLNKAELLKLEIGSKEAMTDQLTRWMKEEDNENLFDFFARFIQMSYGERSEDGFSFAKEDENGNPLGEKFKKTAAYAALFAELTLNANGAGDFLLAVIPQDMVSDAKDANPETKAKIAAQMGISPEAAEAALTRAAEVTNDPTTAPTTAELAAQQTPRV